MSDVYILQNQAKLFLGKQKDWLDGTDPSSLYKTPHKDEAINLMFEVSSKDYTQRIHTVSCGVNDKGLPVIPQDILPEPGTGAPAVQETVAAADDVNTDEPAFQPFDLDAPHSDAAAADDDDHPQGSLL